MLESGALKQVRTPSNTYDNYISLLYMGFDFVFAAHYSRDLSAKVKAGNESKLLKGEYPSKAPIGYKNIPHGIVPDPSKSIYIQKAFALYETTKYSVKTLSKELSSQGFTTKKGKRINKSALHRILSNPEYLGLIRRKGKIYKGNHQPLVSRSLFEKVQAFLQNKNRSRRQKHNFLYRDFLTCSVCGCKITADKAKQKYVYYHCTNGKGACDQHKHYISEQTVETLFTSFLKDHNINEELATLSLEVYKEDLTRTNKFVIQHEISQKEEIKKIETNLQRLLEMRLSDEIDKEMFEKGKEKLLADKRSLEENPNSKSLEDIETTFELLNMIKVRACNLQKVFKKGDSDVKRDLLNSLLSNCYIKDKKIEKVNLNYPFKPLIEMGNDPNIDKWRRRWDSNPRVL